MRARSSLWRGTHASIAAIVLAASVALADDPSPATARPASESDVSLSQEAIRSAVTRSITLIETSAAEYRRQRECFSCHHHAMPTLALIDARRYGFEIDEENLAEQLQFTVAHLKRGLDGYREGRGQGGQADTAAWALWALEVGEHAPDETTAPVAAYLLGWQDKVGHWQPSGRGRPPTQGSDFATTYLCLRALSAYGTPEQATQIEARRDRVRQWLAEADPADTEDRVFQLRSLNYLATDDQDVEAAANELLDDQRDDGGWAQKQDQTSDAYATATALVALHESGALSADDRRLRRGAVYLVRSQLDDGSWHVATRAKPVQIYFESGFPHARDQFISMAATCWAVSALLKTFPEAESGP